MSAIRHSIRGLPPLATVTVRADGIILNGLRYQHPALLESIGDKAEVFHSNGTDRLSVFISGEFICFADVRHDLSHSVPATDYVGHEVMVITGEYQGAAGIVMQVNCDAPQVIYHVRLYGGDELHSYCYSELYFNEE